MGTVSGCGAVVAAGLFCAFSLASGTTAFARSDLEPVVLTSNLGSYLAARIADARNDTSSAAKFYDQALAGAPDDRRLIHRAFLMAAADGDFERAAQLAEKLSEGVKRRQLSNLWLGVAAFKAGNLEEAQRLFRTSGGDSITRLASTLAQAWTAHALGRQREAVRLLSDDSRVEWAEFFTAYQFYGNYHRALIADLDGNRKLADSSFASVIERDPDAVRGTLAYARALSAQGRQKKAQAVLEAYKQSTNGAMHPLAEDLLAQLSAGKTVERLVSTATVGLSEAFYGLGEALSVQDSSQDLVGMMFLQLAVQLRKPAPSALIALAGLYERQDRYARANAAYERIPDQSALFDAAQIRMALNMNSLDKVEDARRVLLEKAERRPDSLETFQTLANIMRARQKYAEAAEYYSKAIALVDKPDRRHWTLWYGRGASYERIKQWDNAEKDLIFAKKLNPDEPLILNYLGYSWVDQDRNLEEGLVMIKRAVALKPKDGYITDSLGWAYYKLGDFEQAVVHLEEAVRLRPEDPVLNDHLGDALWQVGRKREARFQWELALTFEPEPEEVDRIKGKLARGIETPAPVKRAMAKTGSDGQNSASVR